MLVFNGQIPISFKSSSIGKKQVVSSFFSDDLLFEIEFTVPTFIDLNCILTLQISIKRVNPVLGFGFSNCRFSSLQKVTWHSAFTIKASKNKLFETIGIAVFIGFINIFLIHI